MKPGKKIIEIAGERLHVVESGRPDGPPVLLSAGLGGAWFDWEPVAELLRPRYRVLCFDRPGLGLSPAGRTPPSLRRDVELLASLAGWAGAPVTVVAHSVAGFHAEGMARVHPRLVCGMVLVDPSYEATARPRPHLSAIVAPFARVAGWLAGLTGLPYLFAPLARRTVLRHFSRRNPPAPAELVRAVYGRGTVIGTLLTENAAYPEMAADLIELRGRRPFPPIPLVVLTALGDLGSAGKARDWAEGHRRLAAMSPRGRQIELPDAYHLLQLDRPDLVAEAVAGVDREGTGS